MLGILFVGLSVLDAYLTHQAILLGGTELNPLMRTFGDNMFMKGLLASLIVLGLYYFGYERVLYLLCLAMGAVCVWNLVCIGVS